MDATIKYLTCAIFEKFIFLTDIWSFFKQKCEPRPKLFLWIDIFSTFIGVHTLIFTCVDLIFLLVYMRNRRIFTGKSEALPQWLAICLLFFGGFISRWFGDYANINMWKSDYMKTWNSPKCNDRIFKLSSSFMLALKIYKIQRRKLCSAKRKRYQFSFNHP